MANSAFGRAALKAVGMPEPRDVHTVFHHHAKGRVHLHGVASAGEPSRLKKMPVGTSGVGGDRKAPGTSLLTVAQRTEVPGLIVDTPFQPHRDKSSDTSNVQ